LLLLLLLLLLDPTFSIAAAHEPSTARAATRSSSFHRLALTKLSNRTPYRIARPLRLLDRSSCAGDRNQSGSSSATWCGLGRNSMDVPPEDRGMTVADADEVLVEVVAGPRFGPHLAKTSSTPTPLKIDALGGQDGPAPASTHLATRNGRRSSSNIPTEWIGRDIRWGKKVDLMTDPSNEVEEG
jgi:hypothetical protein